MKGPGLRWLSQKSKTRPAVVPLKDEQNQPEQQPPPQVEHISEEVSHHHHDNSRWGAVAGAGLDFGHMQAHTEAVLQHQAEEQDRLWQELQSHVHKESVARNVIWSWRTHAFFKQEASAITIQRAWRRHKGYAPPGVFNRNHNVSSNGRSRQSTAAASPILSTSKAWQAYTAMVTGRLGGMSPEPHHEAMLQPHSGSTATIPEDREARQQAEQQPPQQLQPATKRRGPRRNISVVNFADPHTGGTLASGGDAAAAGEAHDHHHSEAPAWHNMAAARMGSLRGGGGGAGGAAAAAAAAALTISHSLQRSSSNNSRPVTRQNSFAQQSSRQSSRAPSRRSTQSRFGPGDDDHHDVLHDDLVHGDHVHDLIACAAHPPAAPSAAAAASRPCSVHSTRGGSGTTAAHTKPAAAAATSAAAPAAAPAASLIWPRADGLDHLIAVLPTPTDLDSSPLLRSFDSELLHATEEGVLAHEIVHDLLALGGSTASSSSAAAAAAGSAAGMGPGSGAGALQARHRHRQLASVADSAGFGSRLTSADQLLDELLGGADLTYLEPVMLRPHPDAHLPAANSRGAAGAVASDGGLAAAATGSSSKAAAEAVAAACRISDPGSAAVLGRQELTMSTSSLSAVAALAATSGMGSANSSGSGGSNAAPARGTDRVGRAATSLGFAHADPHPPLKHHPGMHRPGGAAAAPAAPALSPHQPVPPRPAPTLSALDGAAWLNAGLRSGSSMSTSGNPPGPMPPPLILHPNSPPLGGAPASPSARMQMAHSTAGNRTRGWGTPEPHPPMQEAPPTPSLPRLARPAPIAVPASPGAVRPDPLLGSFDLLTDASTHPDLSRHGSMSVSPSGEYHRLPSLPHRAAATPQPQRSAAVEAAAQAHVLPAPPPSTSGFRGSNKGVMNPSMRMMQHKQRLRQQAQSSSGTPPLAAADGAGVLAADQLLGDIMGLDAGLQQLRVSRPGSTLPQGSGPLRRCTETLSSFDVGGDVSVSSGAAAPTGRGSMHGGNAHGGSMHGASYHGGSYHAASTVHGGRYRGGSVHGGSVHGGSFHGGGSQHGGMELRSPSRLGAATMSIFSGGSSVNLPTLVEMPGEGSNRGGSAAAAVMARGRATGGMEAIQALAIARQSAPGPAS